VLDFRNTKILATQSAIRQDSPFTIINVAADFYVFSPQRGAVVTGTVKYISRKGMETIVSVVIYRVFNVKVTVKGKVKHELERNHDIQIRVKDFNFDNVIPFIEGEIFDTGIIAKGSMKKLFDDTIDSGISESSVTSEVLKEKDLADRSLADASIETIKIKQERASSVECSKRQSEAKKKRKRKTSSDSDSLSTPIVKKIKVEPMPTTDDELEPFQGISNTRYLEEPSSGTSKKTKKHDKSLKPSTSTHNTSKHQTKLNTKFSDNESTSSKEKKSKKKKRKRQGVDDFETSLQLLLNPNIKKEID